MQPEEQPTLFYRLFENTLHFFQSKLTTQQPIPQPTPPQPNPQQKEEQVFQQSINQLKKIAPKIKGTKLDYMIQRFEQEHVYQYI
jgi:hypothetical protein